jgi:hypothetical protein
MTTAMPSSASQRPKPEPASGATAIGGVTGSLSGELLPASAAGGADTGPGGVLGAAKAADGSGGGTEEIRARGGGREEIRAGGGGGVEARTAAVGGGKLPANGVALADSGSGGGASCAGGVGGSRPISVRERIAAGCTLGARGGDASAGAALAETAVFSVTSLEIEGGAAGGAPRVSGDMPIKVCERRGTVRTAGAAASGGKVRGGLPASGAGGATEIGFGAGGAAEMRAGGATDPSAGGGTESGD